MIMDEYFLLKYHAPPPLADEGKEVYSLIDSYRSLDDVKEAIKASQETDLVVAKFIKLED